MIERNSSVIPRYHLGHHRILLYGDYGSGAKSSDVTPGSGIPSFQITDFGGIWKHSAWYYHADTAVNTVDDCTHRWFREFLTHGTVWTGACANAVHHSQRLEVKPLKSSDWPSDPLGPSWPSFPSIPEWMEMLRKGIDPFCRKELEEPVGHAGYTRVSRGEVKENSFLATRIVLNAIVGIRSSIEVPRKFLRFFRYRQNFLILCVRGKLPIGLVRFLLAQWTQCPYSLWLRRACTLKQYLRKVPISHVRHARNRLLEPGIGLDPVGNGSCTPTYPSESEFDSEAEGLADDLD